VNSAYLGVYHYSSARQDVPSQTSTQESSGHVPNESSSITLVDNTSSANSGTLAQQSYTDAQTAGTQQPQEPDTKSDASFDPLFDDEPDADGELDQDPNSVPPPNHGPAVQNPGGAVQPAAPSGLAVPQHPVMSDRAPPLQHTGRSSLGVVAPPKNAPPLLNSSAYANFSPDLLMTASIDGQVILWDKRAQSPGKGVGRLEMNEKTPPWCLSVNS
jgi:transcriptional activator SPT8